MDLEEFNYQLPESLIAAFPTRERTEVALAGPSAQFWRDRSQRLRGTRAISRSGRFAGSQRYQSFPARLRGTKESGGKVEVLLLERFPEEGRSLWIALVDAAKKPRVGTRIDFDHRLSAEVIGDMGRGRFGLEFHHQGDFETILDALGEPPLPPYVRRSREAQALDRTRYQTVYATHCGAIAAPTAGFHFTPELLAQLQAQGIDRTLLTLHVGPGTFQPVRDPQIENHRMEGERYALMTRARRRLTELKC